MRKLTDYLLTFLIILALAIDTWGCVSRTDAEADFCAQHRCDTTALAFDVDPAYAADAERAFSNLNAASGLDIALDPMGIEVTFSPQVINPDNGIEVCGLTLTYKVEGTGEVLATEVSIATEPRVGCFETWAILRHEVACHALAPHAEEHAPGGICAVHGSNNPEVDPMALDVLCTGVGGCP